MTLVRVKNRDYFPARRSYNGIDDMFNWFMNEAPQYSSCNEYPSTNISESDDDFKLEMLVPGLNKDDIRIQVDNGILTVSYEIDNEEEENTRNWISREFNSRGFSRRFKLSQRLASEKISASYNNGILQLTIPKKEEAKPKPVQEIKIA